MRILVACDDGEVQQGLVAALDSSRRITIACTAQKAPIEIRNVAPDVLVVHVASPADLATISTLAALAPSMYVLALLGPDLPTRTAVLAIAAGSQDVLRIPYTREELYLRVDARERLCRWIGTPHDKAQADAGAPTLRAWQYLDAVVADDLEAMLGSSVQLVEKRRLPPPTSIQWATIPITLPMAQLDLCVSITADLAGRQWLGNALFGDPATANESIRDLMRELANVVGGAFKRSALLERSTVAIGLPLDNDPTPCGPNARYWEVESSDGGVIGLIGDVRARPNRRVPARRLAEGMVVVKDVVNGAGVLLLPSGTRLTSSTAERLSRLLDQTLIDVCA